MYFITENNGFEARMSRLEGELVAMRAEIEALKRPAGRRDYMRDYMRRKRAGQRMAGSSPNAADTTSPNA
jgi:hypothetical protein